MKLSELIKLLRENQIEDNDPEVYIWDDGNNFIEIDYVMEFEGDIFLGQGGIAK